MKKSNLLLVVVIMALSGFFACKSDDISPHNSSQKSNERFRNLIEANHWKTVAKPQNESNIIFLNNIEKATQFFEKMTNDVSPNFDSPNPNPTKGDMVLAYGVFTFLNSEKATINFETSIDGTGEIIDIDLDKSNVTFTQKDSYVENS